MYMVEARGLTVKYGRVIALEEVTFRVDHPSLLTILGPNAAGKTTLLRTILGFIKPFKGELRVLGLNPLKEANRVRSITGYVPQRDYVSSSVPLRVIDVVLMGLIIKEKFPRIVTHRQLELAFSALEAVGLRDLWRRRFRDLSGGQQQKVLIARALASRPKLLLLDEPMSNMDVESRFEIAEVLNCLKRNHSIGIIVVTHDVNPMIDHTDRILLLNRRVYAFGEPSEVLIEDKLREVYGAKPKVVLINGKRYVITGDVHVRH